MGLADGFAQLFEHAEKVIYRILAVENDSAVFTYVDSCLAEFGNGDTDDFKKFIEGDVYIVFFDEISVGRFLQIGGCRLRN